MPPISGAQFQQPRRDLAYAAAILVDTSRTDSPIVTTTIGLVLRRPQRHRERPLMCGSSRGRKATT